MSVAVGGSWSAFRGGRHGPWERTDGAIIVMTIEDGTDDVRPRISADDGATWVNGTAFSTDAESIDCLRVSDYIYVVVQTIGGTFFVAQYSIAFDNWPTDTGFHANIASVTGVPPAFLGRRSTGDYVVFHQAEPEMIMGTNYRRVAVSVWGGASWTQFDHNNELTFQSGLEHHFDARSAVMGVGNRFHLFYDRSNSQTPLSRTWLSNNTDALERNWLPLAGGYDNAANYSMGPSVFDSSTNEIVVPYGTADVEVSRATSADEPVFSPEQVSSLPGETATAAVAGLAYAAAGGVLHAFFVDSFDDIQETNDQGTGTWTDDQVVIENEQNGVNAGLLANAGIIGVLSAPTTNEIRFTAFSLGAPAQSIAVGTTSEIETAQPVGAVADQTVAVGVVAEIEAARPVPISASIIVGAASETEAANAVTAQAATTVAVGTAAEVEAAAEVTALAHQTIAVGAATELETARAIGLTIAVDAAAETEAARAVVARAGQTAAVGTATETETADAVAAVFDQSVAVSVATETEAAGAVAVVAAATVAVNGVLETETAEAIGARTGANVTVGGAAEVETAAAVGVDLTVPVGAVAEAETAGAVGVGLSVGATGESETAGVVEPRAGQSVAIGAVSEVEAAQAIDLVFDQRIAVGPVGETETAHAVSVIAGAVVVAVDAASEVELARAIGAGSLVHVGAAGEVETAQGVVATATVTVPVDGALEIETVSVAGLIIDQFIGVGFTAEVEVAVTVGGFIDEPVLVIKIGAALPGASVVRANVDGITVDADVGEPVVGARSGGTTIPARWPEQ